MNRPEDRIPEEKTQEVFALAAQLYAQHNQSYSVQELMDAGAEAKYRQSLFNRQLSRFNYSEYQLSNLCQRIRRSALSLI
jgi:hypothetical protein